MNNRKNRRLAGFEVEKIVANILARQSWVILTSNFQTRYGEIDLIGRDRKTLVFIEVKSATRPSALLSGKVNKRKQSRMILAAEAYLQDTDISQFDEIRFDVITAVKTATGDWSMAHIRNAFDVEQSQL